MNDGNHMPEEAQAEAQAVADAQASAAAEAAAQIAELNERILRLRADYDNFRRRAERERSDVFDMAAMEAVRAILPAVDDFERALSAKPSDPGPALDYAAGIELIYQRLMDALTKLGLQPVEAAGKPFDPNLHHAVKSEPREDVEDQTVVEEYQRGYNFRGRPLRPAMVLVAVKP